MTTISCVTLRHGAPKTEQVRNSLLGLACIAVLAGILVAGLWPFHAPRNQVEWLPGGSGLQFGRHGTALSASPFKAQSTQSEEPGAIEIGLAPGNIWEHDTILAFYAANHTIPFSLRELQQDLLIKSEPGGTKARGKAAEFDVKGVFLNNKPVLIDVTSDGRETVVYVNGMAAAKSREFAFSSNELTGELIIANSPVIDDSWPGSMRALAVYHQFLSQQEVLRHYQTWAETGRRALTGSGQPVAVYAFGQAAGRVIRNEAGKGPDLYIPRQFTVVDHIFLERPWNEYKQDGSYWKDVLLNIGGFIPLGFIFCAYLSLVRQSRHAALTTILVGAAVSITIEVLQAYLPTRFSGMTDLFTNTLGTAAGVGVYVCARRVCESLSRSQSRTVREVATWLVAAHVPGHRLQNQ